LTLDGVTGLEVELKSSKFCSPLGNVASGIEVAEDGPQWIRGHHHNFVGLEIMAELPRCNEYSIKKLMRLEIPGPPEAGLVVTLAMVGPPLSTGGPQGPPA
jgi:hypothetical protein